MQLGSVQESWPCWCLTPRDRWSDRHMVWRGIQIHLGWPSSRIWRNSGCQVAPQAVPSVHLGQGFWLMMWWHTCLVWIRGTIKVSCSSMDSRWITTARRKSCHWTSWMSSRCVWASSQSSVSRFITMVRSRKCFTVKKNFEPYVLPKWQHVNIVMSTSQSEWTTFMNEAQLRSIVTPHNFVLPQKTQKTQECHPDWKCLRFDVKAGFWTRVRKNNGRTRPILKVLSKWNSLVLSSKFLRGKKNSFDTARARDNIRQKIPCGRKAVTTSDRNLKSILANLKEDWDFQLGRKYKKKRGPEVGSGLVLWQFLGFGVVWNQTNLNRKNKQSNELNEQEGGWMERMRRTRMKRMRMRRIKCKKWGYVFFVPCC